MKIDKKIIKELTQYLDEFNLTEIEYTDKDTKIKVSKSALSNPDIKNDQEKFTKIEDSNNKLNQGGVTTSKQITSPIIGTAYHAPEPGAKKFVEIGKKNKKRRHCDDC